jgi:hypothetical protein
MAAIVVSIICIAMVIVGGMTLSQGILTSADTAAASAHEISLREGEMMRTDLEVFRAAELSWADLLRVTVKNTGQTKLYDFDKWDFIICYTDVNGVSHAEWLPYTDEVLGDNQWQKIRIGLNGPTEFFEPGILNPEEELVILAKLNPLPDSDITADVTVVALNGASNSASFPVPGYTRLTPQSENITIAGAKYYELVEAATADGAAMTETTSSIGWRIAGRWLLYNQSDNTRDARHLFSLAGINSIPADTWTVYYRGMAYGTWWGGYWGDASLNISITIRRADGTIRQTITNNAANAVLNDYYHWQTVSGTYNFPGYTVEDSTDYLEIDYYGSSSRWGPQSYGNNYIRLDVDDDTLPLSQQTRIEVQ